METIKDWQTGVLVAVGKVLPSHPLCIYKVAISASSDELEAPIAGFSAVKEGDVASSPSPLEKIKDRQIGVLFTVVKVLPFACPCICYVVMRASSDELEASIDPIVLAPEVEVSPSPSAPPTKERLQPGNLFPTVKWPPSNATCRK